MQLSQLSKYDWDINCICICIYILNCQIHRIRMSDMSFQWCRHVDKVSMTRIWAMLVALLILLFLGLDLLGCLGTCSSIPVHIHPHQSRARLVIENWWNIQRIMFIVVSVHTRDNGLRSIWVMIWAITASFWSPIKRGSLGQFLTRFEEGFWASFSHLFQRFSSKF